MTASHPGATSRPARSIIALLSGLSLLCLLPALAGDHAADWLRYDRPAILDGQLWRLLSGHFIHLGWSHLAMNLAGLWLIGLLYGHCLRWRQWLIVIVLSGMAISLLFLLLNPTLIWYVGLSGILHTLIVSGILLQLRRQLMPGEWMLLLLVVGKLAWEQSAGSLPGSADLAGGPVIVDAHLYGALVGMVFGLWLRPALHDSDSSANQPQHQESDR